MEPVEGLNASIEEQTKFWSAPPPYQAEIDHEGSDIRAIKLVVSITLGITPLSWPLDTWVRCS